MSSIFERLKRIIKSKFLEEVATFNVGSSELFDEDTKLSEEIEQEWKKYNNYSNDFKLKLDKIQLSDAYRILEVSPDSTPEQIKQAYREKVKKHHPDLLQNMGQDILQLAVEKIKEINFAFELIKKDKGF